MQLREKLEVLEKGKKPTSEVIAIFKKL